MQRYFSGRQKRECNGYVDRAGDDTLKVVRVSRAMRKQNPDKL